MINNFWTSGEMSNSESVVSWRKVAVFGLAVGLPIVGYVVWKRVNKKREQEYEKGKKEKEYIDSPSATESKKPDIVLSAESEGHSLEEVTKWSVNSPKSDLDIESNEYVISLQLEENDSDSKEMLENSKEIEGEFYLTLDLDPSTDISNEATLHIREDDIIAGGKSEEIEFKPDSGERFETVSTFDKILMSDVGAKSTDIKENVDVQTGKREQDAFAEGGNTEVNDVPAIVENLSLTGFGQELGGSFQTGSSFGEMSLSEIHSLPSLSSLKPDKEAADDNTRNSCNFDKNNAGLEYNLNESDNILAAKPHMDMAALGIEQGNNFQIESSFDKMSLSELELSHSFDDKEFTAAKSSNKKAGNKKESKEDEHIFRVDKEPFELKDRDSSPHNSGSKIVSTGEEKTVEMESFDVNISFDDIEKSEKGVTITDQDEDFRMIASEDSSISILNEAVEIAERLERNEIEFQEAELPPLNTFAGFKATAKEVIQVISEKNIDKIKDQVSAQEADAETKAEGDAQITEVGEVKQSCDWAPGLPLETKDTSDEERTGESEMMEEISKTSDDDIEELEERDQAMEYTEPSVKSKTTPEVLSVAKGDYVTSSTKADHVTSVVDDENDIVVIKEDEKTKLEEAPRNTREFVTSPSPDSVSPLYLSHPYTRALVPLGCSLTTVLQTEQQTARRGSSQKFEGGAKFARHFIGDVKTKGLAQTAALRNGQELCYVSKIPTCGMSHDMVVVMVAGINLTDGNPLLLTIRTEYKDEFGVKHEQCDTAVISFSVTPTGFCIKNIQTEPYRGRRMTDTFWNDTRPFTEEKCWIQHLKSHLFLKGSGRQLSLSALKNQNPFYLFVREAVRGRHLPPIPSCSTFWKEPQVMLAFPGDTEKGKHVQQFVSCVGTETVGFLPLQQTVESTDVMNDKDPRLFYFISRGSHCYFMSVMLNDHFLAVAEGLESLCLRFLPEHRELNRHPDLKFTVKYPSTNTNEK